MQSNDIIIEFNGQQVVNAQDLIQKVAGSPVGQSVAFTFLRDRDGKLEKHTANVVLGERPPPPQLASELGDAPAPPKAKEPDPKGNGLQLGITLTELTPQLVAEKHLTGVRGLYVKDVDPNGLAAEVRVAGGQQALSEGDVITRINRMPVITLADFQRVLKRFETGDPIVLHVSRYSTQGQSNHDAESFSSLTNKGRSRVSGVGSEFVRPAPDTRHPTPNNGSSKKSSRKKQF